MNSQHQVGGMAQNSLVMELQVEPQYTQGGHRSSRNQTWSQRAHKMALWKFFELPVEELVLMDTPLEDLQLIGQRLKPKGQE
jgi:hypothetical protein